MSYKFFDKRYLVMPDEKDIIGKKVFYSDHLDTLVYDVESGYSGKANQLDAIFTEGSLPFDVNGAYWSLAYYDPNYEAKVAYSQGRTIEYHRKGDWEDEWHVSTGGVIDPKCYDYRVKPDKWYVHPSADEYGNCIGQPFYKDTDNKKFVEFEGTEEECDKWIKEHTPKTRRYTNHELAKWCADNKGQFRQAENSIFYTSYAYSGGDTAEVPKGVSIREWDSNEWHEPLVVEVKE